MRAYGALTWWFHSHGDCHDPMNCDSPNKSSGAKGKPAPSGFKVCATYLDGYKLTAVCPVAGGKARDKARATADAILRRARVGFAKLGFEDFTATEVQVIGAGEMFGAQVGFDIGSSIKSGPLKLKTKCKIK